jgi:hypothetical protein
MRIDIFNHINHLDLFAKQETCHSWGKRWHLVTNRGSPAGGAPVEKSAKF